MQTVEVPALSLALLCLSCFAFGFSASSLFAWILINRERKD